MQLTPETVEREYEWVRARDEFVVELINDARTKLSSVFGTHVDPVDAEAYRREVDTVFADGDLAVNVAALVATLRRLDVEDDYPGFVVDELLGRQLAGMLAGNQPFGLLGEATFHYIDIHHHEGDAGSDDLDAALAAGFQTRLPGWNWTEGQSPFAVSSERR